MDTIAVVDFGGQYTHLLARRIRQLGVYSTIVDPHTFRPSSEIGLIFSGGPRSVNEADLLSIQFDLKSYPNPVLGICYGHQLMAKLLGGGVVAGATREYGLAGLAPQGSSTLFSGAPAEFNVWMSHGDHVSKLPPSFVATASSGDIAVAAYENSDKTRFGVQFHPEVVHTQFGEKILGAFVERCEPRQRWTPGNRVEEITAQIRSEVGTRRALLLLSGGVDSLVAWALCERALAPGQLVALHVDTGMMRKNESTDIIATLRRFNFTNITVVEAEREFLAALEGVSCPEKKRHIIGSKFVDIANREVQKLLGDSNETVLVQGTIYPDTIESGGTRNAAKIKTHHNRVDAIQDLIAQGLIVEPLAQLYKDEVREVGLALNLPPELVHRHPFPGPGLGVRLLCASTSDCQEQIAPILASEFDSAARKFGFNGTVLPVRSVGVQGDGRTYAHPGMLWNDTLALETLDWKGAAACARSTINRLSGINRMVLALTPPKLPLTLVPASMSKERLDTLREVDAVVAHHCAGEAAIWQIPVVGLPLRDADGKWAFVIRPVESVDGMTADFHPLRNEILMKIVAELKALPEVGTILFDVTSKPPGTIEWE
jgi:GMP synthase (glutamine-hydrolysing)